MRISRDLVAHLGGATVTKVAPAGVQFILLLVVARDGTLDEVGRMALASAASFLCGALAEVGFGTTLSVPGAYFGVNAPPLRSTRRLRLVTAVAGSGLYLLLWLAGLGQHDPRFLLVTPLPCALALAAGYAGVMNAAGRLRLEGTIAVAESVIVLGIVFLAAMWISPFSAALIGLTVGRGAGTIARAFVVRGLPQTHAEVEGVARAQSWFALGTGVIVLQGQADLLAIGFIGSLALAGVYGPLLRTAYGLLLVAEALSWALYGGAGASLGSGAESSRARRSWLMVALGLGLAVGTVFALAAEPLLEFLLDRPVEGIEGAIALLAVLIVVRFLSFGLSVLIVRAGRQRDQVPVLAGAAVVLTAGALLGAAARRAHGHAARG